MTIKIPRKSIGDRVLKALGKKRGLQISSRPYERFGRYAYFSATKESFWKALFRPRNAELPEGMIDIDDYVKEHLKR
jgi:hypothetical protein